MKVPTLNKDYFLVLQQISEDGKDDLTTLEETLRYDRKQLRHIIKGLQHKGLISINYVSRSETWLTLSAKGKRLMTYLWPESISPSYGF